MDGRRVTRRSTGVRNIRVDLLPKVKFEMAVPDARLEEVLAALTEAARTGKIGDGKIFVFEMLDAIRIRNGDRGESAL